MVKGAAVDALLNGQDELPPRRWNERRHSDSNQTKRTAHEPITREWELRKPIDSRTVVKGSSTWTCRVSVLNSL